MFYEMIALYAGKVSNYFRHYANFIVHFLTHSDLRQNWVKLDNIVLYSFSQKVFTIVWKGILYMKE